MTQTAIGFLALSVVAGSMLWITAPVAPEPRQAALSPAEPLVVEPETGGDAASGAEDDVAGAADLEEEEEAGVTQREAPALPPSPPPTVWTARATITAYCLRGVMRSGRSVYSGAVATDRRLIPEGSLIRIDGLPGLYISEDTGSGIIGWWVDIWMASCADAMRWGKQTRAISVVRYGW